MTQNQALTLAEDALTLADDAIVSALSAVGEIMPASVRDLMIAASNWRWRRRLGTSISRPSSTTGRGSHQSYCVMMICSSTTVSQ
jgi:hypothetical protein